MIDIRPGWYRGGEILIKDGLLIWRIPPVNHPDNTPVCFADAILDGSLEDFDPFDYPNLPNAFAKVDNEASAVAFAKKYGLLGYLLLAEDTATGLVPQSLATFGRSDGEPSEPVEWFLAHAAAVRFVLRLIKGLQDGDERGLGVLIDREAISMRLGKKTVKGHVAPVRNEVEVRPDSFISYLSDPTPSQWAVAWIAFMVDGNTQSIRRILTPFQSTLWTGLYVKSLIEAIWYQVGEMALLSQEQDGKAVRACKECGTLFVVTDKRQQFCPGDAWSAGSLCGARSRMRKTRKGG
jgi:hypothetical protein